MADQLACLIPLVNIELGHRQPQTGPPMYTDNPTIKIILTTSMRQKLAKVFDIRFYWMRNHMHQ